ncbi:hypothetical protein ANN_19518 [Periplaneta americana]|uniref:Uncharacterized protein n=1 Tax=Periplaneta americana TaxID=6978 RepID=A0ABQ8SAR6_PERAM|nr:hypothetical protein ANN_19518 [Periplaneta americana]
MWIWGRMERVKWTDRIRNEVVLERVDEERMMLKLIRKRKRNWLGHSLRRNSLLKDALEGMVNGRRVRGRRRYQMVDDIKICGSYAETKSKADNRKDWRILNLQTQQEVDEVDDDDDDDDAAAADDDDDDDDISHHQIHLNTKIVNSSAYLGQSWINTVNYYTAWGTDMQPSPAKARAGRTVLRGNTNSINNVKEEFRMQIDVTLLY